MTMPLASPAPITELVVLLAQSEQADAGFIAVLARVGAWLEASGVALEFSDTQITPFVWPTAADELSGAPARLPPERFPLCRPGEDGAVILAMLVVHRDGPALDADDEELRAVLSLLRVIVCRETRLSSLERELNARLREIVDQRAFIECIVDSLPVGLYVVDRDYRIHAWNHKRETGLQGVSRTDAIGRTIFEVLHRQPAALLKREFDEVFASGRLQQFQMESNAFGDTRTFRISKIPMRLGTGPVTHVITIGEDITEWRAALDRTAQSEKLAALGQLAAGVMHELNNPLATIAACAESLGMPYEIGLVASPPAELLRIIDLEVQRCKKIINGLLDFSRPKPAQRELFDINTVVQQSVFLLQHHPRFKRVKLVTELEADARRFAEGDADQLVQVLIALAMNALDATPEGARVTIRTLIAASHDGQKQVCFEVEDEGPGIPRTLQAKVFEPFFTTKAPGQGTGLGLAICYGIVADHGGQLDLLAAEGSGARFRVSLPLREGLLMPAT